MFSLVSLYFSYRRDVVVAERYIAGLNKAAPADTVTLETREEELELPLAA